jgi:hypothetical protein
MDIEWARRHLEAGLPLRAESHPATDAWLSGDRYGEVTAVGRTKIHVRMDRSGRVRRFRPDDLESVAD